MSATVTLKQCTGTNAGTETTQTNWNLLSTDITDTGILYQTNRILVPTAGTTYSYERWLRFEFTGVFNLIENIKCWKSAGTLSDGNLSIKAGETDTGVTPIDSASSVATSLIPTSEGTAIDISPTNPIDTSGEKTDYFVSQLNVPSTVTTPGDISPITLTTQYDES